MVSCNIDEGADEDLLLVPGRVDVRRRVVQAGVRAVDMGTALLSTSAVMLSIRTLAL